MRAHLHGLRRTGGRRRHDGRLHSTRRRIGSDRRAAVAGTVLQHRAIPCARSSESMTDAPRSLKLPVGMNHSHFSRSRSAGQRARQQRRATLAHGDGVLDRKRNAARYRHKLRVERSISPRAIPAMSSAAAARGSDRTSAAARAGRSRRCADRDRRRSCQTIRLRNASSRSENSVPARSSASRLHR